LQVRSAHYRFHEIMEHFLKSCEQASDFPKNLIHQDTYQHNLNAYVERLDKRQLDLFSDEEKGSLDLMEYDVQTRGKFLCSLFLTSETTKIEDSISLLDLFRKQY